MERSAANTGGGLTLMTLGTAGWIPTGRRETNCYLVDAGEALFVLDAGTGLRRLLTGEANTLLDGDRPIYVLLSHFHLDHVVGVSFFSLLFRGRRVAVLGPGREITGATTGEVLSQLLSPPFFASPLARLPLDLTVADLHEGDNDVGGYLVRAVRQKHSQPSLGLRLGGLCYVTDTACAEQTTALARGASLLLHECWLDEPGYHQALAGDNPTVLDTHCHVGGATRIAAEAGASRLVLIHLNPAYDERRLRQMLAHARRSFAPTELGVDLRTYTVV